jgi:NADH dehydrogenase (ubiquinone) 1 alpha subcomplex subunit 9
VDVAAAIVNSLKDDGTSMGKTYELGGPDVYTVRDLVIIIHNCYAIINILNLYDTMIMLWLLQAELMFETIREWPRYVNLPFPIARVRI